jgi:hypothetical protein
VRAVAMGIVRRRVPKSIEWHKAAGCAAGTARADGAHMDGVEHGGRGIGEACRALGSG